MSDNKRSIRFSSGADPTVSVAEFVRRRAQGAAPLLAWAEPDPLCVDVAITNRTGRRADFTPLVQGAPAWPEDLPLVEARLFWAGSALHVVAGEGGGCRWSDLEEVTDGPGEFVEVVSPSIPVHTLRDLKRFSLSDMPAIEGLQAIEYRQRGRLVAWRLVIGEK